MNQLRRSISKIPSFTTTTQLKCSPPPPQRPPSSTCYSAGAVSSEEGSREGKWTRPKVIPFQVKVANSVRLIGRLTSPLKALPSVDGRSRAATAIAVQGDPPAINRAGPIRIPVIFEGDLAEVAAHHLKENDCIHIAGELSSDLPPATLGGQAELPELQVMVRSFNFIRGSFRRRKSPTN